MRPLLAALALALVGAPAARADFILTTDAVEYTPGQAFNVSLGLGPVANLGLYNAELVIRTAGPVAGTLTVGPVLPAAVGYVFGTPDFFLAAPTAGGNEFRLALSDFTLDNPGATVAAGVNDRITTFNVLPSAGATGPIRLFLDPAGSFLDDADGSPIPVSNFPSLTLNPAPVDPSVVPAPPAVVCGLIGVGTLAIGRRFRARVSRRDGSA